MLDRHPDPGSSEVEPGPTKAADRKPRPEVDLSKLDNLSIEQFAQWAGVSRATTYRLVRDRLVKARKLGGRTIILKEDARAFMQGLPTL